MTNAVAASDRRMTKTLSTFNSASCPEAIATGTGIMVIPWLALFLLVLFYCDRVLRSPGWSQTRQTAKSDLELPTLLSPPPECWENSFSNSQQALENS